MSRDEPSREPSSAVEPLLLRAGPLTMLFEPQTAFLRYLRLGERELIRGIYGAVRDRNWGTVPPRVSELELKRSEDAFSLRFQVSCVQEEIDFRWRGSVTGTADGTVRFAFDGRARSDFLRNRIGLCLLHPAECAGIRCEVETTDRRRLMGEFPRFISPDQPFLDLRAIEYQVAAGVAVEARCEGDVFEMEDQRNWTDASFKTYSTPLALPFPARVERGDIVRQAITVWLHGAPQVVNQEPGSVVPEVAIDVDRSVPLPEIGLAMASHGQHLSDTEVERLRALRPAHLRIDLQLWTAEWVEKLRRAAAEARALGARLHVALFLSDAGDRELDRFVAAASGLPLDVALWLLFHTPSKCTGERWVRLAGEKLAALGAVTLAAGTDANFAELNRQRPEPGSPALPCFSINPQVHAFDDRSLVETLAAQPATVETARQFSPHPVVVSPITLKPRFNPDATADAAPAADALPSPVDPRQASLFCASWTLGSIARLAATGGVYSLTYYETTGWRGVIEQETGPPLPELFPSRPGMLFPVYHLFRAIAGCTLLHPSHSSRSHRVEALALRDPGGRPRILVANLTPSDQPVRIRLPFPRAGVRLLDARTPDAQSEPEAFVGGRATPAEVRGGVLELTLPPHALACITPPDRLRPRRRRRGA